MKRRMIAVAGGMLCMWGAAACLCVTSANVRADEPASQPAAEQVKQLTGRFVTTTVQRVGEQNYTGVLVALPEGAGLVTVLIEPGEGQEKMRATAGQWQAGQVVRVSYKEHDDHQWASELKAADPADPAKGEEDAIADASATHGPSVEGDKSPEKPADEFAGADSRARARIKQLEQRVAELEAELRKMREAAAASGKNDAAAKDKPETKLMTGTTSGRVGTLIQTNVDGKTMPAVVVTVDGVPTVLVIPQVENDKGEKTYDPALRAVVESLKPGQQVKAVWETDGKTKMIKTIEVVPEAPTWPDYPRRRRG